jgi:pimeloyl-ACP methyl ester carboxylesterase
MQRANVQAPVGINEQVIQTQTGQISFFEAGRDSNLPALVLLPGLFCSAQRLITAMMPLSEHTRLVAVDWRGHGKSAASRNCCVKDLASEVMAIIRARLQGSRICILGHSMGARVIWSMMQSFRNELAPILEGIAIIDQSPEGSTGKSSKGPSDQAHATYKRDSQLISLGRKQMLEVLKRLWAGANSGFVHSQTELSEFMRFAGDCDPTSGSSLHWDALSTDYSHVVKSMLPDTQVLLMVGDSTLGPSQIYTRMNASVPPQGAHFALLRGGTHCPHFQPEHVSDISGLLLRLLKGTLDANATPGSLLQQSSGPTLLTRQQQTLQQKNNMPLMNKGAAGPLSPRFPASPLMQLSPRSFASNRGFVPASQLRYFGA